MEVAIKKICTLFVSLVVVLGLAVSPVFAGGDKVQHERGAKSAPGPGDDAKGNQVEGN